MSMFACGPWATLGDNVGVSGNPSTERPKTDTKARHANKSAKPKPTPSSQSSDTWTSRCRMCSLHPAGTRWFVMCGRVCVCPHVAYMHVRAREAHARRVLVFLYVHVQRALRVVSHHHRSFQPRTTRTSSRHTHTHTQPRTHHTTPHPRTHATRRTPTPQTYIHIYTHTHLHARRTCAWSWTCTTRARTLAALWGSVPHPSRPPQA